jgi:hypothetical protein
MSGRTIDDCLWKPYTNTRDLASTLRPPVAVVGFVSPLLLTDEVRFVMFVDRFLFMLILLFLEAGP